jgi:hypothetical protein
MWIHYEFREHRYPIFIKIMMENFRWFGCFSGMGLDPRPISEEHQPQARVYHNYYVISLSLHGLVVRKSSPKPTDLYSTVKSRKMAKSTAWLLLTIFAVFSVAHCVDDKCAACNAVAVVSILCSSRSIFSKHQSDLGLSLTVVWFCRRR